MSIKLALLKSGETIVSDAKELISDDKVCGYLFTNPHIVDLRKTVLLVEESAEHNRGNLEILLTPWIVLTSDKQIPVPPDWIVTIVEPLEEIKQMYEEKVNGKNSKMSINEGS